MSVYGFSEKDHKRVSDTVRRVENNAIGRLGTAKGPRISSDPVRRGRTSSEISLLTGNEPWTPGSGSINFYEYNMHTNELILNDTDITIMNDWEEEVPTDTEAVALWRDGVWWIIGWECA